jgi:NAD(P)H-nitrite reductase large subunit
MAGTGVLRNAADAIGIRAYAQRERSCTAVVAGGGLLGLEAAYALHKLGLRTIVLERSDRLLRQLDPRAAQLLRAHLADLGIDVVLSAEVRAAAGGAQLRAVELRAGDRLEAEILLVAAGITPNVGLARACGLAVHRGIVVDERMRTADPAIYAIGDAAEYDEEIPGLWATAVAQAEIAAENVDGGERTFATVVPATTLKVAGIDLTSIGRFDAAPGDEAIVHEDQDARRYRKLVVSDGRLAGAILLGCGQAEAAEARTAIT